MHCGTLLHPNLKKIWFLQGYVQMWVLYIFQEYELSTFIIEWLLYKKLKYQNKTPHKRRSGELEVYTYETYKNDLMMHINHIYKTAPDMAIATMCDFTWDKNDMEQWKYLLCCCSKCPSIVTTNQ